MPRAGWGPGRADRGWRNRLGGDAGCPRRLAVHPVGVMTGVGCGPASSTAPPLADTVFALRRPPHPGRPSGGPALGPYRVDQGVAGPAHHTGWGPVDGAPVRCPPQRQSQPPWPKARRRWLAGLRPLVAAVDGKRWPPVRLGRARPPELSGLQARWAAKIARQNVCLWWHDQLGRPPLAFTDVVDWSSQTISHQAFKSITAPLPRHNDSTIGDRP
jgi:hypothetical protein